VIFFIRKVCLNWGGGGFQTFPGFLIAGQKQIPKCARAPVGGKHPQNALTFGGRKINAPATRAMNSNLYTAMRRGKARGQARLGFFLAMHGRARRTEAHYFRAISTSEPPDPGVGGCLRGNDTVGRPGGRGPIRGVHAWMVDIRTLPCGLGAPEKKIGAPCVTGGQDASVRDGGPRRFSSSAGVKCTGAGHVVLLPAGEASPGCKFYREG